MSSPTFVVLWFHTKTPFILNHLRHQFLRVNGHAAMHPLFIIWTKLLRMKENPIDHNDARKTALPHFWMRCLERDTLRIYVCPVFECLVFYKRWEWSGVILLLIICCLEFTTSNSNLGFPHNTRECTALSGKLALELFWIRGYIYTTHIFNKFGISQPQVCFARDKTCSFS